MTYRIAVAQPSPPNFHAWTRKRIASVECKVHKQEARDHGRNRIAAEDGGESAEHVYHDCHNQNDCGPADEEGAGIAVQARHEVEDDKEYADCQHAKGNVQQNIGKRICRRASHSKAMLPNDDRALRVRDSDFCLGDWLRRYGSAGTILQLKGI